MDRQKLGPATMTNKIENTILEVSCVRLAFWDLQ